MFFENGLGLFLPEGPLWVRTRRRLCLCAAGKVWRSRVSTPRECKPASLYGYAAAATLALKGKRKSLRVYQGSGLLNDTKGINLETLMGSRGLESLPNPARLLRVDGEEGEKG